VAGLNIKNLLFFSLFVDNDILLEKCDLNDSEQLKESYQRVCSKYGPIHVLVHVAGVFGSGPIVSVDPNRIEKVFNVNLKAVVLGTQICLPFIIESAKHKKASCAVIQIGSVLGTDFGTGRASDLAVAPVYSAAKHGLRIFNNSVFAEVKEHGIKCCCIMPGAVYTPMIEPFIGDPEMNLKAEDAIRVEDLSQSVQYVLSVSDKACPTDIVLRSHHALL